MNETIMTVRGNLVEAPTLRRTKGGHFVANFRIASTQRRFDRETGEWVDGDTLFVTCTAWRALGQNVAQSLVKGQPVIVHGRYYQREFTKDEQVRTAYELDAITVGPDLSRGIASFERVSRPSAPTVTTDSDGVPEDLTTEVHGLADPEVDTDTGEVRELALTR